MSHGQSLIRPPFVQPGRLSPRTREVGAENVPFDTLAPPLSCDVEPWEGCARERHPNRRLNRRARTGG